MRMSEPFRFLDPGELRDGELFLKLVETRDAEPIDCEVPWYKFHACVDGEPPVKVGHVSFRAVSTPVIERYRGHFGYVIAEPFQGRHYAERATRLLLPFVRRHGFTSVWITCDPDNHASRRTIERLGGVFVEIVPVPPDTQMYRNGSREKCRYRLEL
jgi:predicted acetyltransferase